MHRRAALSSLMERSPSALFWLSSATDPSVPPWVWKDKQTKLFSDNLSVPFLLPNTITIEVSFERVHYNFCCFRILIPDIRKCPFVHDHKWIKSNGGVSWEEGGQLGRSLCGQSDRKVTLFAISMNDDAQKQTVNFWSKCDYLCMDNMTSRTDRSIKVFFFGKRKFVGSVHITLNMTLIANETEPC